MVSSDIHHICQIPDAELLGQVLPDVVLHLLYGILIVIAVFAADHLDILLSEILHPFPVAAFFHGFHGFFQDRRQGRVTDGLENIVQAPQGQRLPGIVKFVMAAHDDALGTGTVGIHPLHQLQAGAVRHFNITDQNLHIGFLQNLHRFGIAVSLEHLFKAQRIPVDAVHNAFHGDVFIIHDQ